MEICTIQRKSYSYGTDEEELNESHVEICTIQTKSYSYGTDEEKLNESYVEICTIPVSYTHLEYLQHL